VFWVVLHVKISSHCPPFVGDPQDDMSWPLQIREKIGKHPFESDSDCYDTHYRECLSLCRSICFKIQINVCCSAMQMCVSSQNHSYPFVYLQCWGQQCDFSVFWFCLHLGVYLSQMWLGIHRGGYRGFQVSFSMAALPHSLSLMACCNSCTVYHGGSFSVFWCM